MVDRISINHPYFASDVILVATRLAMLANVGIESNQDVSPTTTGHRPNC
jgi:hypothetical protein